MRNLLDIPGAHMILTGSRPRLLSRNLLIMSPRPCHVNMSTKAYEMKFVMAESALDDVMLANGWGKDWVGDQGIVNIRCRGMPNFFAMCICAKLGGFAMMASATNGFSNGLPPMPLSKLALPSSRLSEASMPVPSPASMQDLQHPVIISYIPALRFPMSPFLSESIPGIRPGFLTMKAMSSAGSPPMLKNSKPFSVTKSRKVG